MDKKERIISLSAIGLDAPGLISKITETILQMEGNILDVEETCRRGMFSIFLVIDFSASGFSTDKIIDVLKSMENETGLNVILGRGVDEEIVDQLEKEKHIVTILGMDRPGIIAKVSGFFKNCNINIENCRMIARGKFFSMEMVIDTNRMTAEPSLSLDDAVEKMKTELMDLCGEMNLSLVVQSENSYEKAKKIVVFDVDSSLLHYSSIDKVLDKVKEKVKSMNKSIGSFDMGQEDKMQVLVDNARLLKGIPFRDLKDFGDLLQLNPGTLELIRILKSMGFKIAFLSSGFDLFVKRIFKTTGVDYAFSNTLKVNEEGIITGELEEPVLTSSTKNEILEFIISMEKISREQVIAIGDGTPRSRYIKDVGLSIAYKPDQKGIETDGIFYSDQIINILYCLGIPKPELDRYLN